MLTIGVILVLIVGALLGRFLSTENTERNDEAALIHLWREKRGEAGPEDLAGNLVVQLGAVAAIGLALGVLQQITRNIALPTVVHTAIDWSSRFS